MYCGGAFKKKCYKLIMVSEEGKGFLKIISYFNDKQMYVLPFSLKAKGVFLTQMTMPRQ